MKQIFGLQVACAEEVDVIRGDGFHGREESQRGQASPEMVDANAKNI
jgi:hypothetical protein